MQNKIIKAVQMLNTNAQLSVQEEDVNSIIWENGTTPIPLADIEAQIPLAEQAIADEKQAEATNDAGNELVFGDAGSSDLYGFVKTDGTGSQKEDLVVHYTNGADDLSVAHNNSTQDDLYNETMMGKRGLSFTVDTNGNLKVTV
jgi:hypothetical protein